VLAVISFVQWYESAHAVEISRLDSLQLWLIAGLCFGVGDVVSTSIGLGLAGVGELHPIAAHLFQYSHFGAMIVLKGVVLAVCYALWRWTPRPHCLGVPLGLITVGVFATAWNLHLLIRATLL
jgi:uncharacterized membrane protein